ncbi:DUF3592 domain-containing protein [Bordetella sp. 2513F-2]
MSSAAWLALAAGLSVVLVAFVAMIVHFGATPYQAERSLAAQLADQGMPITGEVVALERQPGGEPFSVPVKLTVRYTDAAGSAQQTPLSVYIDQELLQGFMPGRPVHLRQDPRQPGRLAVDRRLSPTEIPASWRRHS